MQHLLRTAAFLGTLGAVVLGVVEAAAAQIVLRPVADPALPPRPGAVADAVAEQAGAQPRVGAASDDFARLFPSRVKTIVKASYDPDDRAFALSRGNDDGFSGLNLSEAYRDNVQNNPVAVLAHFAGRPGVMGMFFRNFWSDALGAPFLGENNRTSIWIDGALAHDMPLRDYFRNVGDPRGQVAPFSGPLTGNRAGGYVTHTQLRFDDELRIGLWDDAHHNAARFHRVAAVLGTPEGEVPATDLAGWSRIAAQPGAWPHRAARQALSGHVTVQPGQTQGVTLAGPATLLEITTRVGAHADYADLWARFTWDNLPRPSVEVPLRLLGGMMHPDYSHPVEGLLFLNDGDRVVTCYLPMPFRASARLELVNRGATPIPVTLTVALQAGGYPEPWGYCTIVHRAGTTGTNEPFVGPRLTDCRGMLRGLMLECTVDTTGRIPDQDLKHLEGDLCVRINGNRGDEHNFAASETSIGRWGWYLTPADQPFQQDTAFQTGRLVRSLPIPGLHFEGRRLMGSLYVTDPVHFVDGIDIVLEHGMQNTSNADYELTALLYVEPGAARHRLVEVDVGDAASEALHQVQFTQWMRYTRTGSFLRDQFFGTAPVTDSVRHIRDFVRFRVLRPIDAHRQRPLAIGLRLDRLGGTSTRVCQADVFVDGQPAGMLHCFTHSGVFPWKEGGEVEVELPRALTDGKSALTVELRPRLGSDPLRVARVWVHEYTK